MTAKQDSVAYLDIVRRWAIIESSGPAERYNWQAPCPILITGFTLPRQAIVERVLINFDRCAVLVEWGDDSKTLRLKAPRTILPGEPGAEIYLRAPMKGSVRLEFDEARLLRYLQATTG